MELSYEVHIRTRSTDHDYDWIGAAPDEWWTEPAWGRGLLRLRPCLLREETAADRGRILLTGIQSSRHDGSPSHTRISYDITLTPNPQGPLDAASAAALVRGWWSQRSLGVGREWPLGLALDQELSTEAVRQGVTTDTLLESDGGTSASTAVAAVAAGLRELSTGTTAAPHDPESMSDMGWIGANHPLVDEILIGGSRPIAYFSAVDSRTATDPSNGIDRRIMLIVDGSAEIHAIPKSPAPGGSQPGPNPEIPRPRARRAILLAVAGAMGLLILYLIVRSILGGKAP